MHPKAKLLLQLLFVVFVSYVIHAALYRFTSLGQTAAEFQFSLTTLYLFFGISTLTLLSILALTPQRFKDNLGFVFIWLTLLKMGIAYWFFYSLLGNSTGFNPIEKRQVFIVFAWFLATETYFSTRIVNYVQ